MVRVGIDLVQISQIAESYDDFGERFLRRVFTPAEIQYATQSPTQMVARLAKRFAAKEAAIKALGLAECGVAWTQIEVVRAPSGACTLVLHGTAAAAAAGSALAVSLSHEGDLATAIVVSIDAMAH